MATDFELRDGETILEEIDGDLWTAFGMVQNRGRYSFTNQRLVFVPKQLIAVGTDMEIEYKDIDRIKKCMVGPLIKFIPTGIKIKTKGGKTYRLSLLKRKKFIELLENNR